MSDEVRHTDMRWVPVRCCCTPTKVLGFMRLPSDKIRKNGTIAVLEGVKTSSTAWGDVPSTHLNIVRHNLQIREMGEPGYPEMRSELAIYSEDRPIEFWRKIHGFMEVRQGWTGIADALDRDRREQVCR